MQVLRAGLSFHRLAAIFITHLHGDHFNGLAGLLSTMALDRRERPLTLIGPTGIGEYLATLSRLRILFVNYDVALSEFGYDSFSAKPEAVVFESERHIVTTRALDHRIFSLGYRLSEKPRPGRFDVERAWSLGFRLDHSTVNCKRGMSIELADGRRIESREVVGPARPGKSVAYCLDTRPCENAVALAEEVDWIVYEATYTSELADEARNYGHSTARQAAETARAAGARNLLITHFSSRYPDVTPLLEEARSVFPRTLGAEDLMVVDV